MYDSVKKIIKTLVPKTIIFKNELFFRRFYGWCYSGNKFSCNICNKKLRKFISLKNNDLLCPHCGSLSRNRRLWSVLNENNSLKGHVLHFSPSRSLYRNLKKNAHINYFSSDFENEFLADYNFDITNINESDNKFDTIICYHILEHIIDDNKAISELFRVLKTNGKLYIQTPFKQGEIYEDYSITSPEEREKHFGQSDHVRVYSVNGLKNRLEKNGLKINIKFFKIHNDDFYNGYQSPETLLIGIKQN